MDETYTVSIWTAREGQDEAFVEAFRAYAAVATAAGGAREGIILQDTEDPGRFVVLRQWQSAEAVERWRAEQDQRLGDAVAALAGNAAAYVMKRVAEL